MIRRCAILLCLVFLAGCTGKSSEIETALELRSSLLQSSGCSFETVITADYGKQIHEFSMKCQADINGDVKFTVLQPETISGISGALSGDGGELNFEETSLHFPLLAEEQLSPISAPWILIKTLRSGYMSSACTEEEQIHLTIDDSYEDDALQLDIWLNAQNYPQHADILYDGIRILSVDVRNFQIL